MPSLDVFRRHNDGVLWIGEVETLQDAKELICSDAASAREYIILNLETGIKSVVRPEEIREPEG